MKSVEIGTVYEKISTHNPRKLALVSQRLNATEEYEDGVKIVRRALRNRESALYLLSASLFVSEMQVSLALFIWK
jgi:hypothetical protein